MEPTVRIRDARVHNSYGARCSSIVERPLVVRWVVESIPHGGPIEL